MRIPDITHIDDLATAMLFATNLGYEEFITGASMPASVHEIVSELGVQNWVGGCNANTSEALRALKTAYMAGWRIAEVERLKGG